MKTVITGIAALSLSLSTAAIADGHGHSNKAVADEVVAEQRENLAKATKGKGFGPQSPRDIDVSMAGNARIFEEAPHYSQMNLCNIHFHEGAEHKGGEFAKHAGNGDGKGFGSGYIYSGELSKAESKPYKKEICGGEHGALEVGDTIELHYVHSSAQITPGPTLGACLSDSIMNPQLRVEAQVYVLVNDKKTADFIELTEIGMVNGYHQALNIPNDTGTPVRYAGSTTGPSYNEKGSPLQVSWSVRPEVKKVSAASVAKWCKSNEFDEDHAHGVRNLVLNRDLLSPLY